METGRKFLSVKSSGKTAGDLEIQAAAKMRELAKAERQEVLAILDTTETGLTQPQVEDRLNAIGANQVIHDKAPAWYMQLLQAFVNPFIAVLAAIAGVSLITDVFLAAPGTGTTRRSPW